MATATPASNAAQAAQSYQPADAGSTFATKDAEYLKYLEGLNKVPGLSNETKLLHGMIVKAVEVLVGLRYWPTSHDLRNEDEQQSAAKIIGITDADDVIESATLLLQDLTGSDHHQAAPNAFSKVFVPATKMLLFGLL